MTICHVCDGSGREWFMQGGPYGIGAFGRCTLCKGSGRITIYTCGGCSAKRGHPHPVEVPAPLVTRVDRLREDGWTVCGTCGGSGKVASSCSDQCDYEVACPDCVDGRVPPDGMVEAAAKATFEKAIPMLGLNDRIHVKDIWRLAARAALVAAARWEAPGG